MVTSGKFKKVCKYSSSKGKRVKTDAQSHESPAFMFTSTRTQIAKWKKQQSGAVGDVTEGKHFEVRVDIGNDNECVPVIVCLLCDRKCVLGSKNGSILISNWTRHVSQCLKP